MTQLATRHHSPTSSTVRGAEAEQHPFQAGGTVTDKAREEDAIHGIVERLTNTFSATHSPAEVEDAAAKAHASFTDRPVREFVPVLVERKARSILSKHSDDET
ncbi:three-helix bundle dimerization domain-containing protein [Streptomyces prunicolor]